MSTDFIHFPAATTSTNNIHPTEILPAGMLISRTPCAEIAIADFLDIIGSFKSNRGNFQQIVECLEQSVEADGAIVISAAEYVLKRKVEFSKLPENERLTEADCSCIRSAVFTKWRSEFEMLDFTFKNCLQHVETNPAPQVSIESIQRAFVGLSNVSRYVLPVIEKELNDINAAKEADIRGRFIQRHTELFCLTAGIQKILDLDNNPIELDDFIQTIRGATYQELGQLKGSLETVIENNSLHFETPQKRMKAAEIVGAAGVVLERINAEIDKLTDIK